MFFFCKNKINIDIFLIRFVRNIVTIQNLQILFLHCFVPQQLVKELPVESRDLTPPHSANGEFTENGGVQSGQQTNQVKLFSYIHNLCYKNI